MTDYIILTIQLTEALRLLEFATKNAAYDERAAYVAEQHYKDIQTAIRNLETVVNETLKMQARSI